MIPYIIMASLLLLGAGFLFLGAVVCVIAQWLNRLENRPAKTVEKWFWKDKE